MNENHVNAKEHKNLTFVLKYNIMYLTGHPASTMAYDRAPTAWLSS